MPENAIAGLFRKTVFALILTNMVSVLGLIVDSVIISRVFGPDAMSAFQFISPLTMVAIMISLFVVTGIQGIYARYLGLGKLKQANTLISTMITLTTGSGLVLMTVYGVFAEEIITALGVTQNNPGIYQAAMDCLRGLIPSFALLVALPLISYILVMEGRRKILMTSVIIRLAANIAGVLLVAYALDGGMFGIGLATTLSLYISMAVILRDCLEKPLVFRYHMRDFSLADMAEIFKVGSLAAEDRLLKTLQMTFVNMFLLSAVSAGAMAIYAVLCSLNNIFLSVATGLSEGCFALVSVFTGDRDGKSVVSALKAALKETFKLETLLCAVAFVAAPLLIGAFIGEGGESIRSDAVFALKLFMLHVFLYGVVRVGHKYLQAVGAHKMAYLIPVLENGVFFLPVLYVWAKADASTLWLSFFAAELLTILFVIAVAWLKQRKCSSDEKAYLYLPKIFFAASEDVFEANLTSIIDAVKASRELQDFLEMRQPKRRENILLAMALEEMGKNIVENNEGQKGLFVSIKAIKDEKGWLLRLRDNGKAFNPTAWEKLHKDSDPVAHIGIRMISRISTEFTYTNVVGINNLVVRI